MEDLSVFVPKVHFEQIPIKNLVSNQEYQRNLSASHIQRTVENFDLYQINPVKVSRATVSIMFLTVSIRLRLSPPYPAPVKHLSGV